MVKLYEWFDDVKFIYLIFENCEGGELYDAIIKYSGLDERMAAPIFYQIILALNYIHKQRICHRDIKSDNCIFLLNSPNSPIKLIDYGLAIEYADPSIFL